MAAIDASVGFACAAKSMYKDNHAYKVVEGELMLIFFVISGVLRGFPLSAILFNFAIDPLLWVFSCMVVTPLRDTALACADDLAVTVRCLRTNEIHS